MRKGEMTADSIHHETTSIRSAASQGSARVLVAVAMLALSASGASTASAGERPAAKDRDAWSGPYAGLVGSASRYAAKGTTLKADGTVGASASEEAASLDDRSFGAGVFLGTRARFESGLVLGLETDLSRLGHRSKDVALVNTANTWVGQPMAVIDYTADWLGTARVSAGLPVGNVLFFATGGAALASERQKRTQFVGNTATSLVEVAFTESDRAIRTGFALGGGVEWRFADAWSMRAEYLHVRFRDETFSFPNARGGVIPTGGFLSVQGRAAENGAHLNLVRVGVAYRFGTTN
jgi:opacity protein-like surface antigen